MQANDHAYRALDLKQSNALPFRLLVFFFACGLSLLFLGFGFCRKVRPHRCHIQQACPMLRH